MNQPWKTWLSQTTLQRADDGSAVLLVPHELTTIANSLEFCSRAFYIARKCYPQLTSIYILDRSNWALLEDNKLIIRTISVNGAIN
jgi:hypothetical protein